MNQHDLEYINLIKRVLENGYKTEDRTGTGTIAVFGHQMRFDLSKGFPLITTKKVHWKSIVEELLWMLSGSTDNKILNSRGVTIWDEWANENGDLPLVYGHQWRNWETSNFYEEGTHPSSWYCDQVQKVIERIKTKPTCRRLIVSAWNAPEIEDMALPPCHLLFQFNVRGDKLDCQLYQRSGDIGLGIPFNIAFYALLTHLVAKECNLQVGEFVHTLGNAHIYLNHVDTLKHQITKEPYEAPTLEVDVGKPLLEFIDEYTKYSWKEIQGFIKLNNYQSHEKLAMKVSV